MLETDIKKCIERLKEDLSKLRAGGRFNPDVLESLRVTARKGSSETFKLGDLAQVVPKGRIVQVIVGEQEVSSPSRLPSVLPLPWYRVPLLSASVDWTG